MIPEIVINQRANNNENQYKMPVKNKEYIKVHKMKQKQCETRCSTFKNLKYKNLTLILREAHK